MSETRATNFTDMTQIPPPSGYPCKADEATICPLCAGYGGWILTLNAYPLPSEMDDTSENRAKYSHSRAHCNQCNGWGWVKRDSADAECIHEYRELRKSKDYATRECLPIRTVETISIRERCEL